MYCRYDYIPSIGNLRASPEPSLPSALHRSMSLSALPHGPRHPFALTGRGHSTSDNHDDELDMIKEIIDRDDPLVGPSHHHSLTNIPAELSVSLPALHPSEGLQVLHTYNSAPAIAHSSTSGSLSLHKTSHTAPSPTLISGIMSGLNGTMPDFLSETLPSHKETGFNSDIFPFSASLSSNLHQSYTHRQSSNSAHCLHSDSTHSSTTEQKPSLPNFNPAEPTSLTSHPHSPHLPVLSDVLQTSPVPSSLLRSALSTPVHPVPGEKKTESAHVAREAEVLCGGRRGGGVLEEERTRESRESREGGIEGGELDISVIINQHATGDDVIPAISLVSILCLYDTDFTLYIRYKRRGERERGWR